MAERRAGYGSLWALGMACLSAVLVCTAVCAAKNPPAPDAVEIPYTPAMKGIVLPKGTKMGIISHTPLNTEVNRVGDLVEARIVSAIFVGQHRVISQNTKVFGHVVQVEPPMVGRNAVMKIQLDRLQQPDGQESALKAHIVTENDDGVWGGELTAYTRPYYITHRVFRLGEYNQLRYGGPRAMGTHIFRPVGEHWTMVLDEPIQLVIPTLRESPEPCPKEELVGDEDLSRIN